MLLHLSLTASNVLFAPQTIEGATGLIWSLSIAIAMWVIVIAIVLADRVRPPSR